jgi:hypothetical protein
MTNAVADRIALLMSGTPCKSRHYFAFTLLCSEDGVFEYGCYTGWVRYTDDKPMREVREASLVKADRIVEIWRNAGQTAMVVDSEDDMLLFFHHGGNAVVEEGVARSTVPTWLEPRVAVNVGKFGFASPTLIPQGALNRAPTPKHRMRILQRDRFRCRICGRSPNDHSDLELHVHHVRPWALGGVTEDSNLITLCHTCHNGLEPHFDMALYDLLPGQSRDEHKAKYLDAQRRYAAQATKFFFDDDVV